MGWLRLAAARLRDQHGASGALIAVVFATGLLSAAAPLSYRAARQNALGSDLAAASVSGRGVELTVGGRIAAAADGSLALVDQAAAERAAELPRAVARLVSGRSAVVDSPRWLPAETIPWTTVTLRVERQLADQLSYRVGRPPTAATSTATVGGTPAVVFEAGISDGTARALGLSEAEIAAGRTMLFTPDGRDRLSIGHPEAVGVLFTGIFEARVPAAEYWFDDRALFVPLVRAINDDDSFTDTYVALAGDAYGALLGSSTEGAHFRYAQRFTLDPQRLDIDDLDALAGGLRQMEGTYAPATTTEGDRPALHSRLLPLLDRHLTRWHAADGVLAIAAIGAAGLAVVALTLLAVLATEQRARLVRIAHARGATRRQIDGATIVEWALTSLPAALLGAALAIPLTGGSAAGVALAAGMVVALVSGGLLLATVRRRLAGFERRSAADATRASAAEPARWARFRRPLLEAVVVVAAVMATYLLRERGLRPAGASGELPAADAMLAATPVLVALAGGLAAGRVVPLAAAVLARLAEGRRDLLPALALRRASRDRTSAAILVALVAAATVATFCLAIRAQLERATVDVAWQQVGADFVVGTDTLPLPDDFDAAALPGVLTSAAAYAANGTGTVSTSIQVLALDAGDYELVTVGTPASIAVRRVLGGDEPAGDGTAGPVPAIVSTSLRDAPERIAVGSEFLVDVAGRRTRFRAVADIARFPSLAIDRPFVVTSLPLLRAAQADDPPRANRAFVRAPAASAAQLQELVRRVPGARLESRVATTAALATDPVMVAAQTGVAGGALVAAVYAALAVAAAIGLRSAARSVETAWLRTLGLSRQEMLRLSIAENVVPIAVSFAVGTVLGLLLFGLVRGSIGLAELVGSSLAIDAGLGIEHTLLLAGLLAIAAGGIALATIVERRVPAAAEIRRGVE